MDQDRFKTVVSLLEQEELTLRERKFWEGVRTYFFKHSELTEEQGSILEGVYREKLWMRKIFLPGIILQKDLPQEPSAMSLVEE